MRCLTEELRIFIPHFVNFLYALLETSKKLHQPRKLMGHSSSSYSIKGSLFSRRENMPCAVLSDRLASLKAARLHSYFLLGTSEVIVLPFIVFRLQKCHLRAAKCSELRARQDIELISLVADFYFHCLIPSI